MDKLIAVRTDFVRTDFVSGARTPLWVRADHEEYILARCVRLLREGKEVEANDLYDQHFP